MANVSVISTTIVRPENYDDDQSGRVKIHVTPWDLFFLRSEHIQRGLLFPKPDPETHFITRLKSSLSLTLKQFFPYAGRLVKVDNGDETASFYFDCDGSSGVKFVHAEAKTVSVCDVMDPVGGNVPDFLATFFSTNGIRNCDGESLIAFQVTELKDGVFIGFGYNHMCADGSTFWKFFNTWSENCFKGFDDSDHRKDSPPLLLRRWFLDGIDYPIRIPISETVIESKIPITPLSSKSNLQEKIFRFTKESISKLKAKANGEISSNDQKISSIQSIAAHMWRSVIRNSDLNPNELVSCKFAMDMRGRLNPPLEKECFGNVVGFAVTTTTVEELLNRGLGWAGLQLNQTLGSQTNEKLKEFAENWVNEPKIPRGVGASNCILVASSPWFNVYGNDFGWGKPVAIRAAPGDNCNGRLVVYQGIEQGNIEIQTCLSSHVLKKMLIDTEFLEHISVV